MTKQHALAIPTALYPEDKEYVERMGKGDNFSKKIRSIIREHREFTEGIVQYNEDGSINKSIPGALLIFEKTESETSWADDMPFPYNKKSGWQGIPQVAAENKFRSQIYQRPESGYIAVWVVPVSARASVDCKECKKQLIKFVGSL
jgi:hypothetical protein